MLTDVFVCSQSADSQDSPDSDKRLHRRPSDDGGRSTYRVSARTEECSNLSVIIFRFTVIFQRIQLKIVTKKDQSRLKRFPK